MSFFDRILAPRRAPMPIAAAPALDAEALILAPAVMRMAIAAKDATTELEALAGAVSRLRCPGELSEAQIYMAASDLTLAIRAEGIAALTERVRTQLTAEAQSDAMRLALVAAFSSPLRDASDTGILARMADRLEMPDDTFEALFGAAETLV